MKKIFLLAVLLLPSPAAAQGRGRPPERDQLTLNLSFSGRQGFDSRSAGFRSAFGLGGAGGFAFSGTAGGMHTRVWDRGYFPGEVYDSDLGAAARGKDWNFSAGARSNSDRPFNSLAETDLNLDASRSVSRRGPHTVLLGLNYSSRRSFLRGLPLPYLSYSYNTERLNLFFPFAVKWRPADGGEFSATYFPPRYFTAAYRQKLGSLFALSLQGGLQLNQYLLAGRPDKDLSLFLEQPYAGLRAELIPEKEWAVSLWTCWSFRGRYFTGKQYDDHHDTVRIGAGPAATLSLRRLF